jgi:hypothetical protein
MAKKITARTQHILFRLRRSALPIPKGNKHVFKCNCGKEIIITTNVYDNSNSGMGSCECVAVVYIN